MQIKVTKAYLDMARCFHGTEICSDADKVSENAMFDEEFARVSCIYIYSHMAIMAFVGEQLYDVWKKPDNMLRRKYPKSDNFKDLMEFDLRDPKCALKELACIHGISPIHKAQPEIWRELNQFLRKYRNYFVHPDPQSFPEILTNISGQKLNLGPRVATEIIMYFYTATETPFPAWLSKRGVFVPKIIIVGT